jgi:hypothetical protein
LAVLSCAPSGASHAATVTLQYDFSVATGQTTNWVSTETFSPIDVAGPAVKAWGYSDSTRGTGGTFSEAKIRQYNKGLGACGANELQDVQLAHPCPETNREIDDQGGSLGEEWVYLTFPDLDADKLVTFKSIVIASDGSAYDTIHWYGDHKGALTGGLAGKTFQDVEQYATGGTFELNKLSFNLGGNGNFLLIGPYTGDGSGSTNADTFYIKSLTVELTEVPAPASIILFASGLLMLAGLRIRRLS